MTLSIIHRCSSQRRVTGSPTGLPSGTDVVSVVAAGSTAAIEVAAPAVVATRVADCRKLRRSIKPLLGDCLGPRWYSTHHRPTLAIEDMADSWHQGLFERS